MQKCELCGSKNPNPRNRFCSVKCRNTHNAQYRRVNVRSGHKVCPVCGNVGARDGDYCASHMDKSRLWKPWMDDYLVSRYPHDGSEKVAKVLRLTQKQVLNRVSVLGITLTENATKAIVNDAASEYMKSNNPMFSDKTRAKVRLFWKNNPDKHQEQLAKLFEGHRKLQKNKPSKLELKLFGILDDLGVSYESHHIVKPKFIVDARIGNLIIQADGEYWHGHPRFAPLTERQIAQRKRDSAQDSYLSACGYTVERIWERDMNIQTVSEILHRNRFILDD